MHINLVKIDRIIFYKSSLLKILLRVNYNKLADIPRIMESYKWPKITEATKSRKFISPNETLAEALSHLEPKFTNLFD
jgi:hypothetical protein